MEYRPRTMARTRLLMRDPMECSLQVEESHLHLIDLMEIALELELDAQFQCSDLGRYAKDCPS